MLGEHRAKPYLCLLEHIRRIVMKRFQNRKEQCATWNSEIPPIVNAKIIKASRKSRLLKMLSAGNGEYELLGETRAYVAKLNLRSCECGIWKISGVPCSHALAGIVCAPELTKTAFQQTYASMIHPVPDRYVKREPDERPKGTRGSSVVCRKCGLLGHNKRTCKGPRLSKIGSQGCFNLLANYFVLFFYLIK
ncbi:hypothetical protein ACOSQ3_003034 [Xanthoceras sorbifolium]